jgi:DNA-binding XRE family transcriptional regulator
VADAVGVTYSAIKMYELGSRMPKDDIKIKLANYFNVPVGDLFFSVEHHKT